MTLRSRFTEPRVLAKVGRRLENLGYVLSLDDGVSIRRKGLSARAIARLRGACERHTGVPRTILDVGAHRGEFLRFGVAAFPGAETHSFEPNPDPYSDLRLVAAALDGKHECHELAIGDSLGSLTLNVAEFTASASRFPVSQFQAREFPETSNVVRRVDAEQTTVDQFLETHPCELPLLLKADVQGGELAVLSGARRLLEGNGVMLLLEISFRPMYDDAPPTDKLLAFTADLGYYPVELISTFRGAASEDILQADVVFARPA